jgi:hypothetical protein
MGYDYRFLADPDPSEREVLRTAEAAFQAAVAARDAVPAGEHGRFRHADGAIVPSGGSVRWQAAQAVVDAAAGAVHGADVGYFRLTLSGGSRYAGVMETLGMLRWGPEPAFPKLAEYLTSADLPAGIGPEAVYEAWRHGTEQPGVSVSPTARQKLACYDADTDTALTTAPDHASLWGHKIAGSNDGWVTIPAEIHAALAAYDRIATETPEQVGKALAAAGIGGRGCWEAWIGYLRRAATDGGGFTTW